MRSFIKTIIIVVIALAILLFLAFRLSPYPSVWIIRFAFDKEAIRVDRDLERFVTGNIETIANVQYDEEDEDAFMDVYFDRDTVSRRGKCPVIVWTHGGGLVSGSKNQLRNYSRILASRGYVVISIDYTIAPKGKYPAPIRQLNKALRYISSNPDRLKADTASVFLAGDSGGSMIAAATANIITNQAYAQVCKVEPGLRPGQLKGLLLYCGIYDIGSVNTEGDFGSFLKTVMWAYFGKKDISNDEYAKSASVTNFLTGSFPPSFISAGNKDPLLPQSKLLAAKLSALNVPIDTLFYPDDHVPALGHEYQFVFDEAGKQAFERSLAFLESLNK